MHEHAELYHSRLWNNHGTKLDNILSIRYVVRATTRRVPFHLRETFKMRQIFFHFPPRGMTAWRYGSRIIEVSIVSQRIHFWCISKIAFQYTSELQKAFSTRPFRKYFWHFCITSLLALHFSLFMLCEIFEIGIRSMNKKRCYLNKKVSSK